MPEQITVAMIETKLLDLKTFPIKQQEVQLKIEGDTDPRTLQRLRDHILPSVQHHRKVVNEYIAKRAVEVSKAKSKKEAEQLVKKGHEVLEQMLQTAVPKVQASAEKFFQTDNEAIEKYQYQQGRGRIKFWALFSWAPVTIILSKTVFADNDPAGWLMDLKGAIDTIKDIGTFMLECKTAYEESNATLEQVISAIAVIRKIKAPKKVEAGDIDKLKLKTKGYSARLLGLEMEAKKAAKLLDEILKSQEKLKGAPKSVLEQMEQNVSNQLDIVHQLNDTIEHGKKVLQSANDHIKNAEKRLKTETDWTGWLGLLGNIYEAFSSGLDSGLGLSSKKYADFAFNSGKYLGGIFVEMKKNENN